MNKRFITLVFFLLITQVFVAQFKRADGGLAAPIGGSTLNRGNLDSLPNKEIKVKLSGKTKYTDYKIISHSNDTTIIDTTLTLQKEYKFNFLRKDNFELLAFHNQGQTFNNLGYSFSTNNHLPDIGFRAKQFGFMNIEDINYYHVPTPTTEILYRTGLEQGQVLDALFTLNFSKRFNMAIAYKGLRSLGKYRRALSSTGNFRYSFRYESPKGQYTIKGHAVNQDFLNQENGGLTESSLEAFINDDPNFSNDRGRLDVNLNDAESTFEGKRLYVEQTLKLLGTQTDSVKAKDSLAVKDFTNLKLGHAFTRESKFFRFDIANDANTVFGDKISTVSNVSNRTDYLLYNNEMFLDFNSKYVLGKFRVKSAYTTYDYGYDNLQNNIVATTKNRLTGDAVSFGAEWRGKIKNFHVNATGGITPGSGRLSGNNLYAEAFYKKDSVITVKLKAGLNSKTPNFNFLLHQSAFNDYNWQNDYSTIDTRIAGGEIESKWGNASVDITNISNYAYFDENNLPKQYSGDVNYLKVKLFKEFKLGKFALANTLMYQKVANGEEVFRVPEFVSRNTLYYSDNWFKGNPLYIQIGATLKYFTKYQANAYNPLLGEFTLQNNTEIGYPTVDFFVNGRVRRTRLYLKADNISSFFLDKNYLSAPGYPYRDFVIRFGVVWNWFI